MTRRFTPPPDAERCMAVRIEAGVRGRCADRRLPGGELCQAHKDEEDAWGIRLPRVKAPEVAR